MMRTPGAPDPLSPPLRLEALLAPLTSSTFFASYWFQTFYHGAGSPGKFALLLPWNELNRILEQHALEPPRLRLIKSGAWIDPRSYTDYRYREGQARARLSTKVLTDHLRDGATLILNDIDGLYTPLTILAESLERHFGVPVGINAYAGCGTSPGFNLHADDHDAFILQVSGSKRWLIYGTGGNISDTATLPPDPLWDQTLRDGDLLYIPRGWHHAAIPLNEPCMHLTISVANPSAPDLLAWLADELRTGPLGQLCVSRLAEDADRTDFVDRLRNAVLSALEPAILQRYFESSDANRRAASHFSLPWSATVRGLPLDDATLVRLTSRRPLSFHVNGDPRALEFTVAGRTWRYPPAMGVLLDALREGRTATIEDLIALGRDTLGDQLARAFLATLIKDGLIFIVRKTPG